MVVGHGDIASALIDREDFTYFASGVSDSQCTDPKEFDREINLLFKQDKNKKLVYFSSLSIYDKDTPYTKHKRTMEGLVKSTFRNHCIIRLGNILWGTNPNTFLNALRIKKDKGIAYEIRDEWKYMCGVDDLLYWTDKIPTFNTEINITGQRMKALAAILKYL